MVKIFQILVTFFGFNLQNFYRYNVEGYPFEANIEDSNHFDSFDQYDLPSLSEINIASTNAIEASWPFSLWQKQKTETEPSAELLEFKSELKDKNIIHLMARPLQVYYRDSIEDDNITSNKAFEQHICRATVSAGDIYHTFQIDDSSIDILFICSTGKCCGLDCCRLNITFIFTLSCITLAIASFACYFLIRALSNSKKLRKLIPFLKLGKHHRVIKREKCQKRKPRTDSTFDLQPLKRDSKTSEPLPESPPNRKKSQSVKIPPAHRSQQQLPEILLTAPPTALSYSNSVPSKQRKPKDEILL